MAVRSNTNDMDFFENGVLRKRQREDDDVTHITRELKLPKLYILQNLLYSVDTKINALAVQRNELIRALDTLRAEKETKNAAYTLTHRFGGSSSIPTNTQQSLAPRTLYTPANEVALPENPDSQRGYTAQTPTSNNAHFEHNDGVIDDASDAGNDASDAGNDARDAGNDAGNYASDAGNDASDAGNDASDAGDNDDSGAGSKPASSILCTTGSLAGMDQAHLRAEYELKRTPIGVNDIAIDNNTSATDNVAEYPVWCKRCACSSIVCLSIAQPNGYCSIHCRTSIVCAAYMCCKKAAYDGYCLQHGDKTCVVRGCQLRMIRYLRCTDHSCVYKQQLCVCGTPRNVCLCTKHHYIKALCIPHAKGPNPA